MKNGSFTSRFGYAWAGVRTVWRREKSFRMHCGFVAMGVAVAAVLQVGLVWWAILGFGIALVLAVEMLNAALEYLIDRVHPDIAEEIRHAKDAAAGAVLLTWIGAGTACALMMIGWWLR